MKFEYKEYGRIFVGKEEDIQKVKDKIKEIDDYEYGYMPTDLIIVWNGCLDDLTNVLKFDELDIDNLCEQLQGEGIRCAWVKGVDSMWCEVHTKLTIKQAKLMYDAGFMSEKEILEEFGLGFLGV